MKFSSYQPTFKVKAAAITTATMMGAALFLCESAHASIITLAGPQSTGIGSPVVLDVNGDGLSDVMFAQTWSSDYYYYSSYHGDLYAYGLNGARVTAGRPLSVGSMIDETLSYIASNHLADYDYSYWYGGCDRWGCYGGSSTSFNGTWNQGWNNVTGYLGFELSNGTEEFFGWANVSMTNSGSATINALGYETCANVGIAAGQLVSSCVLPTREEPAQEAIDPTNVPEPSPLALLAIGAAGVAVMRRRRAGHA